MTTSSLERQEGTPSMLEYDVTDTAGRRPPALATPDALRGSDDVLELCRTGLPAALDAGRTEGSS